MKAGKRALVTAFTAVLAGALVVTAPMATGQARATEQTVQPLSTYVVKLKWGACPSSTGAKAPFQCAAAPAPLDYAKPDGTRIELELIRLPAADPKERIGSLFINFGGPGGVGTTLLPERATTVFGAAIRDRFDLVSWDTRGTGLSTAVHCFATEDDDENYFDSVPYFPYPASTDASFWSLNAQLGQDCEQQPGIKQLLPHLSSQDTARDLDLLRQDVGDAKLNYLGFSYGTVIGATYANLFPHNVRAMVLDGTVDFKGNAIGDAAGDAQKYPVDVRNGVDVAAQQVFNRFMSLCTEAGSGECPFAAGGDLPAKWRTILTSSQANPIQYDGGTYFYSTIVAITYYNLDRPMADWPALGDLLQGLYDQATGQSSAAPDLRMGAEAAATYQVNNENEGYYVSQCADIQVPTKESVYDNLAVSENAKVPGFGTFVTYDMTPCATWPALNTDAYDGPWNRSKTIILVVNSRYDSATPYQGAVEAAQELGNARLLTVNGDGHTSEYSEPSSCRDDAEQAYLISLKLPPRGEVCAVNQLPWGLTP
jgi:pimeloyl-ACP methyl ester carboxylesterase